MTLADESLKKRAGQLETGITTLFGSSGLKGTTVVADNKILLILTGSADKEKRPKLIEDAKKLAANWKGVTVINETEDAKPAEPKPDVIKERNAQIMSGVESILKDTDLKAVPAGNAKLTVFILGDESADVREEALVRLCAYQKAWGIFDLVDKSNCVFKSAQIKHPWQLHYFHNDTDLDGLANPEQFVTGLNYLYGKQIVGPNGPGTQMFAEFKNATVWMNGTGKQIDQSRALLTLFDSRSPVVNATAWAIQHAGPAEKVNKAAEAANNEIKRAQWRSLDLAGILVTAMAEVEVQKGDPDPLLEILDIAGFETSIENSLSLLQILVRLGAHSERERVLVAADKLVRCRPYASDLALVPGENAFKGLYDLLRNKDAPSEDLQLKADRGSILNFIEKAVWFDIFTSLAQNDERGVSSNAAYQYKLDILQAPERLQGASESLDRHLDHLTKAFNDDLERMLTKPMLERIRSATGVTAMNGRVSVIVASGRGAGVLPELVSYSQTQTTRSLDETLFKLIAPPGSKTTTTTSTGTTTDEEGKSTQSGSKDQEVVLDTTGQSALAKLLAGMPLGQATLLAGLLGSANDERFVKVAPGVELQIRPVVGPDHLSANVKITTKFGVETTLVKTNDVDEGKFPLPDAVKSHTVSTVAPIPGFGYTELSTLDIQTLTPRPAASIPLLGQIPILGSIFRFPQSPAKTTYQSSILVSCTVTPRVLGLFQYYSGGNSGSLGKRLAQNEWLRGDTNGMNIRSLNGTPFDRLKEILKSKESEGTLHKVPPKKP